MKVQILYCYDVNAVFMDKTLSRYAREFAVNAFANPSILIGTDGVYYFFAKSYRVEFVLTCG